MSTIIQVHCPICGDQSIGVPDIYVTLDDDFSTYTFHCPVCEQEIEKPADDEVISLLIPVGVEIRQGFISPLSEESINAFSDWLESATVTINDFQDF